MPVVVKVDFAIRWNLPVYVIGGDGSELAISGPKAGLAYLKTRCDFACGPRYRRAMLACVLAMRCRMEPGTARKYFVAAYTECVMLK